MTIARRLFALGIALALTLAGPAARAFCGFYVGGAGSKLYAQATQVVLMREGLRTVLSMANDYSGPPQGFAMVVPVPVVLQKENVKTLSAELFDRLDQLDAPRLVEYWEQDPCHKDSGYGYEFSDDPLAAGGFGPNDATIRVRPGPASVRILNRFSVGEYQILILSAQDSLGLDTWLRENGYAIPAGAEPVLRPYVQAGMKFFVAKVDPAKVHFDHGRATLSPLRFHYDSETFALPIRLGLLSSPGTQDLVVHVLARGQRYEAANYDNAVIPTNLDVLDPAKNAFGTFYAALFDHTLASHPGAMITEYAWDASSCDPCPTPPLDEGDLAALGGEVFPPSARQEGYAGGFVLTRLHTRYRQENAGADIVFRAAPPISGGRESRDATGALEQGARSDGTNNFQARYALRHAWTGPIACAEPRRGVWGADPRGLVAPVQPAQGLAFAPRGDVNILIFLGQAPPELGGFSPATPSVTFFPKGAVGQPAPPYGGCAGCTVGAQRGAPGALPLALLVVLAGLARRRRRASVPAVTLLLLALGTGCARTLDLRAETAAGAGGAGLWIAGTEGFAAFSPGAGPLARHDYPRAPGAPDYAYEPFSLPAATLLIVGGQTFLFTRHADVLLFQEGAWSRVPVKLETGEPGPAQLDVALEAPDGQILLQLHGTTLIWATPADLRRGVYRAEKTENYLTWLGFLDGKLHAVGWGPGGNRRAVQRYAGAGRWEQIGLLPEREMLSGVGALLRLPGGRLAVASGAGLYAQTERGFTDLLSVETLLIRPAQVAAPAPEVAKVAAPREERAAAPGQDAPAPSAAPDAPPRSVAEKQMAGEPLSIPQPPSPPSPGAGLYLTRVLERKGAAPLIVLLGATPGLLVLEAQGNRFVPCAQAASLTAAADIEGGVRLVGSDAAVYELRREGCLRIIPPALGEAAQAGSPPR